MTISRSIRSMTFAAVLACATQSAFSDEPISYLELPRTPFYAVLASPTPGLPSGISYGEFSWLGPKVETLLPLVGSIGEVAANGDRTRFFGMGGHQVSELTFNPSTTEMLDPQGVPELSWTMGMTYDTTHDRLITATLGGQGFLYSYQPGNDQWSVISSLNGDDLTALAHFPPNDHIYGVGAGAGGADTSSFSLYDFDSNGTLLSRRRLDIPVLASFIDRSIQLIAVDDYLAFIQYPADAGLDQPTIYAIDPIAATAHLVVIPEPSAFLLAALGLLGLLGYGRRRRGRVA